VKSAYARQEEAGLNKHIPEGEQWLRMLIDSAEDYAIFAVSPDGKITSWNRGAEKVFGYRAEEIIGREFSVIFTAEDKENGVPKREIDRAQQAGYSPDERWHVRKDGSQFFVSGSVRPLKDTEGRTIGFLKVAHDITEQRRKERELQESEGRLRFLVENVKGFAMFTLDLDGRITHWSPAAEGLLGYSEKEILGQRVDSLYSEEDQNSGLPRMERELALQEGSHAAEHWLVRKDGQRVFVIEGAQRIQDEEGKVRGIAKVARDITKRKKLEDELREAIENLERLVSERTARLQASISQLEAFSYSLSHDLRAPLRAIRAFSEILSDKFGNQLGPEGKELAERIIDGARRLDQLIQDVLSFGRVGREEIALDAVDLEELLGRLIATWPEFRPPNADVVIAGPLLKVLGHENLLGQCFLNLLQNAVKFVAPGRPPKVRIWTEARDGRVRVWVEDNGIGIAKDQQERIFGLFQRLHRQDAYPGTGVGLAIVRKAVERMGGTTGVESDPGQGSRFWLELAQPVI